MAVGVSAAAVVGVLGTLGAVPAAARADDPDPASVSAATRYQVTLAARACADAGRVMANRVRDDLGEAPAAPGRDSQYSDGRLVDPDVEDGAGAGCDPLTGWRFTFGSGITRTGALSTVTGPNAEAGPTVASVPRLDPAGQPAAGTVDGAVTVTLTEDQLALAVRRQLWVQGGRPADPLLGEADLTFGALRCGADGRGDGNIQWIAFPSGIRHVYCFAYYVRGAPAPASVVVRAKLTRPVGYPQRLWFAGTLSYAPSHGFALVTSGAPVETTLTRATGAGGYQVTARPPSGWRVAELSCTPTRSGGVPAGRATVDAQAGRADLTLAPRETTTCTYTFEPPAVPAGLSVRVVATGGAGSFAVTVTGPADGDGAQPGPGAPPGPWRLGAVTGEEGTAVAAGGADLTGVAAGRYTLTVDPPTVDPGQEPWRLGGAACGGAELRPDGLTVVAPVTAGVAMECVLRVARPVAGLRLRTITTGQGGSAGFAVAPIDSGAPGWGAVATTRGVDQPADASGNVPAELPAGGYLVTAVSPLAGTGGGWKLNALDCGPGSSEASAMDPDADGDQPSGPVLVTLRPGATAVTCVATWRFVRATRLQVSLRADGVPEGRDGPAVVEVSCADGSTGRAVLGAGDAGEGGELPAPLSFLWATRCTVTVAETGVAEGARVLTAATLDPAAGNAPLTLPATVQIARDVDQYTVTVTETFDEVTASPSAQGVPREFRAMPVLVAGAGLVGLGAVILLVMVARWRRNQE